MRADRICSAASTAFDGSITVITGTALGARRHDHTSSGKSLALAGTVMTGATVALCGVIGFVGLVVPHVFRLAGGADNRYLLPASAVGGAALLCGADTLARTLAAPAELPIGVITALCGAPVFIYLLLRQRRILLPA